MTINGQRLPWTGYGFTSFTPTDAHREHAAELAGKHLRVVQ